MKMFDMHEVLHEDVGDDGDIYDDGDEDVDGVLDEDADDVFFFFNGEICV